MRIFITGGSGFIGGHAIEALAGEHQLLAMARSERSAGIVAGYGAAPVRCALGEVTTEHLAGCDAVIHCAAFVEEWGTREQFWSINVEGTQQLLDVARAAGVPRFVHIGTEAAIYDGSDLIDVDETHPYPERQRFLYSETKAEAERRVLAANAPGFVTLSIRPRLVWGPRDQAVLPAVLEMIAGGQFAWLDGGRAETSTTHVANLVRAIELALTRGEGGRAWFVADSERSTVRDFLTQLVATRGVQAPGRSLPSAIARPLAVIVEGLWRLLGLKSKPPMTRFAVFMMSSTITVKTDRARDELGYAPVIGLADGMAALREAAPPS